MDGLIVRAMKASEFDIATKLTPIALATARKARQIGLMARIKDRGEELAKLADVFVEVQKAEKVLEETPNDSAANLTVGRFRCFIQADWEQGLPMLAIGSDAALKKLAVQELNVSKSREIFLVADGWVKVAEQETVTAKGEIRKHAAGWFFRVLPSLTGLERARAEQTVLALSPWRLAPIPRVADKSVVAKRRKIKGAKVFDLTLSPREMAGRPQWSDDGKYLFHMDMSGLLSKISVPEFQIVRQLEISKPCTSFGRSSLGLVAVLATSGQMWVIDEQTLFVKKKIDSIGAHRAACSPLIPLVYLTPENHNMVAIVDLVTGKPEALIQANAFSAARLGSFSSARLTPDGRYFLCASNGSIWRFGIGSKKFLFEQKGPAIASQSSAGINVGPASRYVAYTKGAGNWDRGYGTYVYDVKNLVQPKLKIESGNYPRSIGFDGVTGKVYAQNFDTQLIVFSATGQKETEYELTRRGDDTNDFIVHPAGSKLLVQCNQLIWVELP